jgi:hypothetical protein
MGRNRKLPTNDELLNIKNNAARRVQAYCKPTPYKIIMAHCENNGISTADFVSRILEDYCKNLPDRERQNLIRKYDELSTNGRNRY